MVGSGFSDEFPVNIGLKKGRALSPLLFTMVVELISRKISSKDVFRKMMYADDLAITAESKPELQDVLEEWKGVFKTHGLAAYHPTSGWMVWRSSKWMALCTLEEWLRKMGIHR